MTVELPSLLALTGTALTAVAILAPRRLPVAVPERSSAARVAAEAWAPVADAVAEPFAPAAPRWPELVDPSASALEPAARRALIDALGSVRSRWARTLLERALDDEPEPGLREAIHRQLG